MKCLGYACIPSMIGSDKSDASTICVVGSACVDLVFRSDRFPQPGETILGKSFTQSPGGKGANQASAIARLGGASRYIGAVGQDAFGELMTRSLNEAGVDINHMATLPHHPTGCAGIVVDATGQNQIVVAPGANAAVSAKQVIEALAPGGAILAQLEVPLEAIKAAAKRGRLFLNPAPACALPDEVYARSYAVLPNESEAEAITGVRPIDLPSCRSAALMLLDRGVQHVVLTRGAAGCYWRSAQGDEGLFAPPAVAVVDTIGAGDAFCGALVFFLIGAGHDWPTALNLANHAAALSTTRPGALPALPSLAELGKFAPHLFLNVH